MFECSRVAARALPPGRSGRYCAGLGACAFAFASACTDPVFTAAPGSDAGFDAGTTLPAPRTEPPDSGAPLSTLSECEQVVCPPDTGVTPLPMLEAGAPEASVESAPEAGIDPIRAGWIGRYAARSTLFSFDDPLKSTAKLLSVVTIKADEGDGLMLEEELCFYQGSWSFLYSGQLTYTYVNARGSAALHVEDDKFESELMKLQIGYGPTPADCRAGSTLMKREYQAWLSATCDCPRNEDTPTSARDCRVIDQEDDRAPGATFPASIDNQAIRYRAAQEERLQFRAGYRLGERLHADRLFEDTTRVLDCTINGTQTAAAACPQGVPKPCPSKHNKVELFEVGDNYDCERVIAQEHALFLLPPPSYPDTCPAELSGALPP